MVKFTSKLATWAMMVSMAFSNAAVAQQNIPLVGKDSVIPPLAKEFGPQDFVADSITDRTPFLTPTNVHADNDGADEKRGAFRFVCEAGQLLTDDPVVYPGKPGKSHLHDFYGSATINAYSTYASNRLATPVNPLDRTNYKTVGTTCQNILNKSGYWNPAMLNGPPSNPKTRVVRPEHITVYYKRFAKWQEACDSTSPNYVGRCVATPNAIAYVFGFDMVTDTPPTGGISWDCRNNGKQSVKFDNMVDAMAACPDKSNFSSEAFIHAQLQAPPCWDGKNLRSANNRSHIAYMLFANTGREHCPLSHPYLMPAFELGVFWKLQNSDKTIDTSGKWSRGKLTGWRLASDNMPGMPEHRPGSTWHADYFEGWDELTKKKWTDNCIDRLLNCSGGDLGDGTALKSIYNLDYQANRRLFTRPKMAKEETHGMLHAPMSN